MDELMLIVEGVQNKIRKLIIRNNQLKERAQSLEVENGSLKEDLKTSAQRIAQLENDLTELQAAKMLESADPLRAKQKINELLREIEKTTVLLNR